MNHELSGPQTLAATGPAAARGGVAAVGSSKIYQYRVEVLLALVAFAVLCVLVLRVAPRLVEPDDYAYRASIVAMTEGHFLTLSNAQVHALDSQLGGPPGAEFAPGAIPQWVQLPDGRWISEKDPGYPFLAAPFQGLGIIRWAPLFYGALACLCLFLGAWRWLGRFGGAATVGLYCSSGAALLFAWRDYMPTFTDASLIAAGTGVLLWAVMAAEASSRRRTWAGLAGFGALEAATVVRYTNLVVLGCAVVAAIVLWRRRATGLRAAALGWRLGSVAAFGAGVAIFDDLVYGGPLSTGYRPGEIQFGLGAILRPRDRRHLPARRLAGDSHSRPCVACRPDVRGHGRGDVRARGTVLPRHGGVQARHPDHPPSSLAPGRRNDEEQVNRQEAETDDNTLPCRYRNYRFLLMTEPIEPLLLLRRLHALGRRGANACLATFQWPRCTVGLAGARDRVRPAGVVTGAPTGRVLCQVARACWSALVAFAAA